MEAKNITIERVGDLFSVKLGYAEIPNVTEYWFSTDSAKGTELFLKIKFENPTVICEISIPEAEYNIGMHAVGEPGQGKEE